MKLFHILGATSFSLMVLSCRPTLKPAIKEQETVEAHGHTHYPLQLDLAPHKLIYPSKVPDRVIVNLTTDPSHSFAVNWRTDQQVDTAYVEVALTTAGPEFLLNNNVKRIRAVTQMFENQNRNEPLVKAAYHSAIVDGLSPNTSYIYRVGDGSSGDNAWSEWHQIETANGDDNAPFSFIYFGDAQNQVKSLWSRVIRKSYKMMPEVKFMLHAGDLINDRDANLEWGEWFYAGSFIHATVPSIMTPGNHEYRDGTLTSLWRPQFNLPQNGPTEDLKETCYAIDYQNMKLISIDAESFDEHEDSKKAQVKWLDSVLATNDRKWTAITMHFPIFSTAKGRDNKELREALKPLIDKYGVDLVLQGHDHTYARGHASNEGTGKMVVEDAGAVYTVSVSGPKMYESMDEDWMVRRGEYTQLFQILTVSKDTIQYESYTPMGSLYDAFDLIKTDDGNKKLINRIPDTPQRFKKDFVEEKK